MSKSFSEYKRFLNKERPMLSGYEKKLARLVLDNFRAVEACGTAGGKRGKLIAKLIEAAGDLAPDDLNVETDALADDQEKVVRLSSIKVENFRGFSSAQTLEFKNPYTFVYGPNCVVSCGHIPRRSMPLLRAKAVLDELIAGFPKRSPAHRSSTPEHPTA